MARRSRPSQAATLAVATLLLAAIAPGLAHAQRASIDLGVGDLLTLDQPRVTFGLVEPGTFNIVGPNLYNSALLDTGANGILLGQFAYIDGENYGHAIGGDGQWAYYLEQGVAGQELLEILPVYDLVFEGSDTQAEFLVPDVAALGAPFLFLGGFGAIVGMPAMAGRVTTLDLEPQLNWDFIGVGFSDTRPAPTAHSYHVNLDMLAVEYTGQLDPADPLPTFSALPMIPNVRTGKGTALANGEMLLDTGAQTVIISSDTAIALGIDYNGADKIDELEVGGVGGSTVMPLVVLDHLTLPTEEGVDLVYTDLIVGVLDIPGIAGVFGMNLLDQGYIDALLGQGGDPAFTDIVLDFTDPQQGVMRLDMFAAMNNVAYRPWVTGDYDGNDVLDTQDINPFILAMTHPDAFAALYPWVDLAAIDPSGDGVTNTEDINPFIAAMLNAASAAAIPEPSTLTLLLAAPALLMRRRRRLRRRR